MEVYEPVPGGVESILAAELLCAVAAPDDVVAAAHDAVASVVPIGGMSTEIGVLAVTVEEVADAIQENLVAAIVPSSLAVAVASRDHVQVPSSAKVVVTVTAIQQVGPSTAFESVGAIVTEKSVIALSTAH